MSMRARSPLAEALAAGRHGRVEGVPGVRLHERTDLAAAAIALRAGNADALADRLRAHFGLDLLQRPGCAASDTREVVWTAPGQWLALNSSRRGLARYGFAQELAAALGDAASVTDFTGARAILRLSGPAVRDMLAKLVPVDLDESVFPPGSAALTLAAHIGVTLWRPPTAEDVWDLACYRSFGESLLHAVLEASAEFGCEVSGATLGLGERA